MWTLRLGRQMVDKVRDRISKTVWFHDLPEWKSGPIKVNWSLTLTLIGPGFHTRSLCHWNGKSVTFQWDIWYLPLNLECSHFSPRRVTIYQTLNLQDWMTGYCLSLTSNLCNFGQKKSTFGEEEENMLVVCLKNRWQVFEASEKFGMSDVIPL